MLCLLALAPGMLEAQVVLYSLNGIAPSPLGSVYGYGQVAAGDSMIVRFRALNTGASSITITCLGVKNTTGAGFSIVNSSSTPFVVAAGQPMDFFVGFSATAITSYAATLQVGTGTATDACGGTIESAILLATVVPAPILSVAAPCTGPDANKNISFGRIVQGTQEACTFSILNPFPQALTVSPLLVTGAAFTTTSGNAVTIAAGQSSSFTIQFSPATGTAFRDTHGRYADLCAGGDRIFSTVVFPGLELRQHENRKRGTTHAESATFRSGDSDGGGNVTLTFSPSVKTVTDDTAVRFVATSTRIASFAVNVGATAITLNAQPNIVFSTGTTAGTHHIHCRFRDLRLSGSPSTSITTAPAPIALASSAATSRANELDVVISGFDNTYSIGSMSFAFVDRGGAAIATIPADFSPPTFKPSLKDRRRSSFLMRASFPVTGDVSQVGGVTVILNNAAGIVTTPSLKFP